MVEMLYALTEQTAPEAEEMFYEAIHDSRLSGFQEGIKAMLRLIAEVR